MTELLKVLIKSCKNEHKDSSEGDFFFIQIPASKHTLSPRCTQIRLNIAVLPALAKGRIPTGLFSEDILWTSVKHSVGSIFPCYLKQVEPPLVIIYKGIPSIKVSLTFLSVTQQNPKILIFLTIWFYCRYFFTSVNIILLAKQTFKNKTK